MDEISIVNLEISNSINDDVQSYWQVFNSRLDKDQWVSQKESELEDWNTGPARSFRYHYVREYDLNNFLELDMSSLKGLSIKDFLAIIQIKK